MKAQGFFMRGLVLVVFMLLGGTAHAQQYRTVEELHSGRQAAIAAQEAQIAQRFDNQRARYLHVRDMALVPEAAVDVAPAHRAHVDTLKSGCRDGDLDACIGVAQVFAAGRVVPRDVPLAEAIYWLGCDEGHDASCRSLDRIHEVSTPLRHSGLLPGIPWREDRCAQGDAKACVDLSELYAYSRDQLNTVQYPGVRLDHANGLLSRACMLVTRASTTPFECSSYSDVLRNLPEPSAMDALEAGCAKGIVVDCLDLAMALEAHDPGRAFSLYALSCRLGGHDDCGNAAYALLKVRAQPEYLPLLIEMHELMCGDGSQPDCHALAELHREGPEDIRDPVKARYWLRQTCDKRDWSHGEFSDDCLLTESEDFDVLSATFDAVFLPALQPLVTQAREGCAAGDGNACYDLATIALANRGAPFMTVAVQSLRARACDLGVTDACGQTKATSRYASPPPPDTACASDDGQSCAKAIAAEKTRPPQDRMSELQARCAAGNGAACGLIGGLYSDQILIDGSTKAWSPDRDLHLAADFYRMGCDLDDGRSCRGMADIAKPKSNPTRAERSLQGTPQEVFEDYAKGCQLEDPESCSYAAGLSDDPDQTFRLSLQACRLGDPIVGCDGVLFAGIRRTLSNLISQHGALAVALMPDLGLELPHSSGTSRRLQRGCASGTAADCMDLAALYNFQSSSLPAMRFQMQHWQLSNAVQRQACDLGLGDGCAELANWARGKLASDPLSEYALNKLGCEHGSARACYQAGDHWGKLSQTPDPAMELRFTEKACWLDGRLDCHLLAGILRGDSVAEYDQKVLRCLGGEGTGCYLAGYYAKYDKRIPRDMQRALYEYGCQLGSDDACQAVASMR
tara:strand:- start:58137 stop:60698 length:2562 start_codon:yes stop_codon:yes gene_type:complete